MVVVPKKSSKDAKNVNRLWRMSFPEQEREIITDENNIKPLIILLKAFRDKNQQQLMGIASYYLKTVVMHMIKEQKLKPYWNGPHMAQLFLKVTLIVTVYFEEIK